MEPWMITTTIIVLAILSLIAIPFFLRVVVGTNEVHIIQAKKVTKPYGKGQLAGNAYYDVPAWVPFIGIQTIKLPLSNFSISLQNYAAYDAGRLPLELDVIGFFRVDDPSKAAERISNMDELHRQLSSILQGAIRSVLAKEDVEAIMSERSKFGDAFTEEVKANLQDWGVVPVKSIELMDIRDGEKGNAITNIMAKKSSLIEKESRINVAENKKQASIKETEAKRDADLAVQEAAEKVGQRTALQEQHVGIAKEQAKQEIASEAATTAQRDMAVMQVKNVRAAEIAKEVAVVQADMVKQSDIINAQGVQQQTIIKAEGDKQQVILQGEAFRDAEKLRAEAVLAVGNNEAEVIKNKELAPVQAQIALAKEIGSNDGYQTYLVKIEDISRARDVGIEQAKALTQADIRVVVQAGNPESGLTNIMDLFSGKGGQNLATMVETFAQNPVAQKVLEAAGIKRPNGTGNDRPNS